MIGDHGGRERELTTMRYLDDGRTVVIPGAMSFNSIIVGGIDAVGDSQSACYRTLLVWWPDPERGIDMVRGAAGTSPDLDAELVALLWEYNWRAHVPAAVAMALGHSGAVVREALWEAFSRSWACPKLAAAAMLSDPEFDNKVRAYLDGPVRRWDGVTHRHQSKQFASLVALCRERPSAQGWLDAALGRPEVQEALADDARCDHEGEIARHWLEGMLPFIR